MDSFSKYVIGATFPVEQLFVGNSMIPLPKDIELLAGRHTTDQDSPTDWALKSKSVGLDEWIKNEDILRTIITSPYARACPRTVKLFLKPSGMEKIKKSVMFWGVGSFDPEVVVVVLGSQDDFYIQKREGENLEWTYEGHMNLFLETFPRISEDFFSRDLRSIEYVTKKEQMEVSRELGLEPNGTRYNKVKNGVKSPWHYHMLSYFKGVEPEVFDEKEDIAKEDGAEVHTATFIVDQLFAEDTPIELHHMKAYSVKARCLRKGQQTKIEWILVEEEGTEDEKVLIRAGEELVWRVLHTPAAASHALPDYPDTLLFQFVDTAADTFRGMNINLDVGAILEKEVVPSLIVMALNNERNVIIRKNGVVIANASFFHVRRMFREIFSVVHRQTHDGHEFRTIEAVPHAGMELMTTALGLTHNEDTFQSGGQRQWKPISYPHPEDLTSFILREMEKKEKKDEPGAMDDEETDDDQENEPSTSNGPPPKKQRKCK